MRGCFAMKKGRGGGWHLKYCMWQSVAFRGKLCGNAMFHFTGYVP